MLAGVLAAIVGFASTFALVLAALAANGATPLQAGSGLLALCAAVGLLNILGCLWLRVPVSFAWTTPGAAFLLTSAGADFAAATGAFLATGLLIMLAGLLRPLGRAISAIPPPLANAMLAGILLDLCLAPFEALEAVPFLMLPILLAWVIMLRIAPRFAVPVAVLVTGAVLAATVSIPEGALTTAWPRLEPVVPRLDLDAILTISGPLFIVTMASQNLAGLAVMRANGYSVPAGPIFVGTGLMSAATAMFGGLTVNLAAITAAITAGSEAHPDPARRWVAPLFAGLAYIVLGCAATLAAALIAAAPPILIEAVAGLALLSSLGSSVSAALIRDDTRLPAVVTFVATASGVTISGIGAPFWGLMCGVGLLMLLSGSRRRNT